MKLKFLTSLVFLMSLNQLLSLELSDFVDLNKCDQIIDKGTYSVCYSYKYKSALAGWTTINGKLAIKDEIKERPKFYEEQSIPAKYRTRYKDYTGYAKDWNRGHFVVADADADYDTNDLIKTYSMVNIIPQSAKVNQKTWIKVEKYGRLTASKLGTLNSISIADYSKSKYSFNGITVPNDLYRIYYNNNTNFKRCFHYKNTLDVDIKTDKLKNHEIDCNVLKNKY